MGLLFYISVIFVTSIWYLNKNRTILYQVYNRNRVVYMLLKTAVSVAFIYAYFSLRQDIFG